MNLYSDQQFTIAKNSITATISILNKTITINPTVTESNMTASTFSKTWGIAVGTTVKCVHISSSEYSDYPVDIFITTDNTYTSVEGHLFEIEKQ